MKIDLIIGTDTDVGKTEFSGRLARYLATKHHVAVSKPLASGIMLQVPDSIRHLSKRVTQDTATLFSAQNTDQLLSDITPFVIDEPIAPHIGLAQCKRVVSALEIAEAVEQCVTKSAPKDTRIVFETAGGLMMPLSYQETWVDVLKILDNRHELRIFLVAGLKLGALNHTLMTQFVLAANGLTLTGWVGNIIDENMSVVAENIATLDAMVQAPCIGIIPFESDPVQRHKCIDSMLYDCAWIAD